MEVVAKALGEARCRVFDWKHRIETCGSITLDRLTIQGANASHGIFYYPSHPKYLFEMFSGLPIDHTKYRFLDLGSGKGRVLLIASEFPFLDVRGVEFAKELHDIAVRNIARYRSSTQKCCDVRAFFQDAIHCEFPEGSLVIYMFNPFRPPVLAQVLRNLQRSIEQHPRDVLLIYGSPFHGQLVTEYTSMKRVEHGTYHDLFRTPSE